MRDLEQLNIRRAVVHLVLPRQERLVLSESELAKQPPTASYLERHIRRGLDDPQARAANFVVVSEERVAGVCDRLLSGRPRFVHLSQLLARRLYDVTIGDDRISDATLAVLLCEGTPPDGVANQFVALLKLDPADAFRAVEKEDARGRVIVELEMEQDVLPRNERVQKAAFIRAESSSAEYRILLVDRQTEEPAARFFTVDFLGAEFVLDAEERTRRLHRSLQRAKNAVAPDLSAQDLAALDQVFSGAQVASHVNIDDLVASLPVPSPVRTRVDAIVSGDLPDREFDLDPDVASRLVRRRTFRADNGLRLSVPAEFYEQMVKVADVPNSDPPRRRITIETQTWREQ